MGRRSASETIFAIYTAFLKRRSWTQAELARTVEISVPQLRTRLMELERQGVNFIVSEDPPHVRWTLSKEWHPAGVTLDSEAAMEVLRLLHRLPRTKSREQIVTKILTALPKEAKMRGQRTVPKSVGGAEEMFLSETENYAERRRTAYVHYFSASRGHHEWRHVSIQRVVAGPPARLVAHCHRSGSLKWFRVDNILAISPDPQKAFVTTADREVEAFLEKSVDGFQRADGPEEECSFRVRDPEARWVKLNLKDGMRYEQLEDGVRISAPKSGLLQVARFVVGLGRSAVPETAQLRSAVQELANGSLEAMKLDTVERAAE